MTVLGIETSCDETSASVVLNGREVLSNIIASQVDTHAVFGGVVPEVAARSHIEAIGWVVDSALETAGVTLNEIDGFAVANGPGLAGALLVGLSYAKALAFAKNKPLIGVNHMEGHVCANYLNSSVQPPFLCLVVSGGHTSLVIVHGFDSYEVLARTRDDAAGEAFDKTARILRLPYPGGPNIDRLAAEGDSSAVKFPRPSFPGGDLSFSFSGLKSAVAQYVSKPNPAPVNDIAASFQQAVVDVLVSRTMTACERYGYTKIALAGGVAANKGLRAAMRSACNKRKYELLMPEIIYCTDNAAMIACRGYFSLTSGRRDGYNLNSYATHL
jgi:N6-L-threonylcarbamoyladenine synthase